jgi:hypothetical protein
MKIRIESDGRPTHTKITDENGNPVHGITRITIQKNMPVTAELVLQEFHASMRASFSMTDPRDGKRRKIRRIEFEDAEPFEPGA